MKNIISTIEKSAFGVCQYMATKMGVRPERVRLYFVYTSFFTFGSPVILYLAIAFWINIKTYMRNSWVSLVR